MSLVVQIGADVRSAIKGIEEVSLTLKEQRVILANLRKEFAALSTQQVKSKIGQELAADIKLAQTEIKRLEAGSVSSFGNIGNAATKGFSVIRQFANILPGIGIAGIFSLAFQGISSLFDGLIGKSDELSKKLKELIVPIQDIKSNSIAGTAEELSKVTALSHAVLDQTLSYKERNNALNQLKEINKSYFGDLTLEESKLGLVKKAVDDYTAAIINAAIVKGFSDEIGKLAVALSKEEKSFNNLGKAVKDARDKLKKSQGDEFFFQDIKVNDATSDFQKQGTVVGKLRGQMFELRTAIQEAVNESLNFKPLKLETSTGGIKDTTSKIIAEGKRLAAAFGDISKIHLSVLPEFTLIDSPAEELAKAKEIIKKVKDHAFKFGTKADVLKLIIPVKPEPIVFPPDVARIERSLEDVTRIIKEVRLDPIELQIPFDATIIKAEQIDKAAQQFAINVREVFRKHVSDELAKGIGLDEAIRTAISDTNFDATINGAIQGLQLESLSTIGEAIGTALAGGDLKNVFGNFANVVASGVQAIGKEFIKFGVIGLAAKKALRSFVLKPELAIIAGIALVAAGAALKAAIGNGVKGFAQGGRPPVGVPSLVGEKGKELFIPDSSKPSIIGKNGPELFRPTIPGTIISNKNLTEYSKAISNVFNKNGVVNNVFNSDKLITNIFNSKEVNREVSKLIQVLKSESKLSKIFSSVFKEKLIPGFEKGGRPLIGKQSIGGEKGKEIWIPDIVNSQITKVKETILTNKPTIIGGNGPEIFKPTVPGIIIPNNKIGQAMNSIKNYFSNNKSFSSPLTNIFNSTIMKRESGGSVFAGIPFLGGEGGREIFFPASQRLNPNNNLSSIQGSAMQMIKVEVNGRLDGRDIVLSGARTNRSQGRNF